MTLISLILAKQSQYIYLKWMKLWFGGLIGSNIVKNCQKIDFQNDLKLKNLGFSFFEVADELYLLDFWRAIDI